MRDEFGMPGREESRAGTWVTVAGAVAGAAVIYFLSTERGRQWIREFPDAARGWAGSLRQSLALLREISEQVEQSIAQVEQALGHVGETLAARESAGGTSRNGGEHALTG